MTEQINWKELVGKKVLLIPKDPNMDMKKLVGKKVLLIPKDPNMDMKKFFEDNALRCPECKSIDVDPIPSSNEMWECNSCKAKWREM